ncbi:MAG: hypothetical protein M3P26_06550 [Gemmatimonadota bacterium]|nr:hypothetical protein [Gemmatimonadota bacterium]
MNGTAIAEGKSRAPEQADKATQYSVAPPGSESIVETAKQRIAIFVAHGMGQQIPFETLDAIAESLRAYDAALTGRRNKPASNTIKSDDGSWLQRVELDLKSGTSQVEAHVYEGYWAPLTEGRITLRQVMNFLAGAGSNGLKIARRTFRRWLLGEYRAFPTPIRIVLYLLVALATVAALVALNSTIAIVVATRALFSQKPWWLTDGLFADLTTTFNAVVTTMAVFGASLAIAHYMRRLKVPVLARKTWAWVTLPLFALTVFVVILAGVSVLSLLFLHIRGSVADSAELWQAFFSKGSIDRFNAHFDTWALALVLIAAGLRLLWWVAVIVWRVLRDLGEPHGRWLTIVIVVVFLLLVLALIFLVLRFLGAAHDSEGLLTAQRGVAWPLLLVASAFIRLVLVQFVGDVAIYVMPYKLDAFNDLRKEIKETVYKVAHAVYALKDQSGTGLEYDRVIVLGHSLGSVIAYDALNRLIHEDRVAAPASALHVVDRTPLFLTFGSPLDKTAFIFGAQGHGTTEARESLAASVQPLIQNYDYRPKQWINIYSPWDIISGYLDLYDLPGATNSKKVDNRKDPEATTLLMAHTEYWNDRLLIQTLYNAV